MPYPNYTTAERITDGVVHVIGVSAALVAVTTWLWAPSWRMGGPIFLASAIYGGALILMLGASATYHLAQNTRLRPVLRRIDHAAIYVKIAATCTPFGVLLGTVFGYGLLGLVWGFALAGAAAKLMARPGRMITGFWPQMALGWAGVALIVPLWGRLPEQSLGMILAGGLVYSAAVIFYRWDNLHFATAIWHAFVLVATGCFFVGISSALAVALQVGP